ncbi:MAG: efflux RND transporter periplasmic adaptor subunit [Bacteroidia bacterium]|nr:efflux RND transporter periplasmic adaptor subunit [Bacteroidia bacterium]
MRFKNRLLPLLTAVLVISMLPACGGGDTDHAHEAAAETWTCPMHPSVISDRPGACPVCHMDLVKKAESADMSAEDEAMLQSVSLSPAQRILANVTTVPVLKQRIERSITAVGVVDFAEPLQSVVSARFRGRVEKLHINFTGASVRKGQALFDLYSPELITAQQDYLIAFNARRKAVEAGNAAAAEIQSGMIEAIRGRLLMHYGLPEEKIEQLERAGKAVHTVTYPSPRSGTVTVKNVREGGYVDDGTAVYEIADFSRVWVYIEVPEQDIRYIRNGQTVRLTSAAWPGEEFSGRVTFIDPVMNAQTRTVRVRVETANPGGKLKPGMYVSGGIALKGAEILAVPVSSVIRTGRRDVVWVEAEENRFEPRTVRLGAKAGAFYEVLSGIDEGSMVAESGGYLLDSESTLLHPDRVKESSAEVTESAGVGEMTGAESKAGPREIKITVDFGYSPEVVRVKAGEKVRLLFHRVEDSRCTDEVVFPDFDIRKKLPAFKTTVVEFTPKKKGTFTYSCGMDMLHGKLIVE